jgi:Fur family peroxide stress response transcriptional regulator
MDSELKQLQLILQKNDIKPTFIRLKILGYLEQSRSHPDAEEIFTAVKKEIPTISMTSIYNTLDVFQKKNLIRPLFVTGKEARFEIEWSPHHHFFCKKCGMIVDLDAEYEYFRSKTVEGHKVTDIQGFFKGMCKNCIENQKNRKGENNGNV